MTNQKFKVGDKVEWISSGVKKVGVIVGVVPAGKTPAEIGYPKAGGGGDPRDHETYVAKGIKIDSKGPYGSRALYWPFVSLLSTPTT
ncbi:hypothetical protein [Agrobacterium tumefaciens]|uniref:hypothetical protein n=1 Tax=Agrobacterium tumefaciens TaxID=358 RepID=UPI001CBDDEEC|nr:hypothetical protein [Agrobacterium tumefaciens]